MNWLGRRPQPTDPVPIFERYRDYTPPVDVKRSVRLLLECVPSQYLSGLRSVTLTNSTGTRELRRGKAWSRKRKVRINECLGFYQGDHIVLLVDNLLKGPPAWMIRWPPVRNLIIAETLYHEIGHHIHRSMRPVHMEREDVADKWQRYLVSVYLFRRYAYLHYLKKPFRWLNSVRIRPLKNDPDKD
jgi:hypothetical protein